jgi:hypothetical protein
MRIFLAAAILVVSALSASAACPIGTKYQCSQMPNGKMQCGCY